MTNYDDESEVSAKIESRGRMLRDEFRLAYAEGQQEVPADPLADALHGQLGEDADSETVASWNLRRIRHVLGVSQQQLSDKLARLPPGRTRLSQSQIAKIERRERPWRMNEMFDIAEALGVSFMELFRSQMHDGDPDMTLLAARLAYQQASEVSREAQEAWAEAERRELEAARKVIHTAAYLGIKDPEAMKLLSLQASSDILDDIEFSETARPESITRRAESAKDLMAQADARAEKEWARLVEEIAKRKAERAGEEGE